MKTISVVMTRYNDMLSNLIYMICGGGYTHSSISVDEDCEEMYSFNFKGFCRETMEKHRRRGVTRSVRLSIRVTDSAYERLRRRIEEMQAHREQYSYTRLGVLLCLLHVPFARKYRYFCSQFVAEMLETSGAMHMKKHPSLYFPNHVYRELRQSAQLCGMQLNPV